ncbi:MAG TPA: ABC transporter permease [Gemmatimonadales bacterium]
MIRWLASRTTEAALTAAVAFVVLVILLHLLPGDPLTAVLRDHPADPAVVAALRHRWGTDRTVWQSLIAFGAGLAHGDLGVSVSEQRDVLVVISERLPATLLLGGLTLLIDFTAGLAIGVWSALHPDSIRARLAGAITVVGYALPAFVVGLVLVWIFAVKLGWFPPSGASDPLLSPGAGVGTIVADRLRHLALPLATLVIATLAVPLRQQRTSALAAAAQPWVLAARARGVRPGVVAWRHCWRPALTPIVTLLGLWLPMLVAGSVFVESVFAWPGVGLLLAQATAERDIPLVMATGFVLIVVIQTGSVLADLLYRVVDPAQRPA